MSNATTNNATQADQDNYMEHRAVIDGISEQMEYEQRLFLSEKKSFLEKAAANPADAIGWNGRRLMKRQYAVDSYVWVLNQISDSSNEPLDQFARRFSMMMTQLQGMICDSLRRGRDQCSDPIIQCQKAHEAAALGDVYDDLKNNFTWDNECVDCGA